MQDQAVEPAGDGAPVDVVIVGYGPVGAVLAILLAQLGRRVVVLERWPTPYRLPRAVHFDDEVGRILQGCGLGPALHAISEPAEVYEWRNGSGTTLLRFGRVGAGPSGWPFSSMFCQPELEDLLATRVDVLGGIEVQRGVEVTAIDQHDGGVVVRGTDGTGEPVAVTAAFAVGCDGANSTVRSIIGVPVQDLGFFYDWLIVDVVLDEPRVFDPLNLQICDPGRPTTAVSGGPGRRRWEFMRLPDESLADLNREARAWELLADWDVHPGNARLERHAVYTFGARYVEQWRSGRILLAGDAAHQMPPFAGQGMCSGIRDAANLAWKLDLVVAGSASIDLLDTYAEERMPDVRAAIDLSMALGSLICVPDIDEAAARDAAMSADVGPGLAEVPGAPPIPSGIVHPGDPLAGHALVQGVVEVDGTRGPFDDLLPCGWRLVTTHPVPAIDADLLSWFASIDGVVIGLGTEADAAVVDVDGTYADWFEAGGVSWVLERPDHRVYGAVGSAGDAEGLLRYLARRFVVDMTG